MNILPVDVTQVVDNKALMSGSSSEAENKRDDFSDVLAKQSGHDSADESNAKGGNNWTSDKKTAKSDATEHKALNNKEISETNEYQEQERINSKSGEQHKKSEREAVVNNETLNVQSKKVEQNVKQEVELSIEDEQLINELLNVNTENRAKPQSKADVDANETNNNKVDNKQSIELDSEQDINIAIDNSKGKTPEQLLAFLGDVSSVSTKHNPSNLSLSNHELSKQNIVDKHTGTNQTYINNALSEQVSNTDKETSLKSNDIEGNKAQNPKLAQSSTEQAVNKAKVSVEGVKAAEQLGDETLLGEPNEHKSSVGVTGFKDPSKDDLKVLSEKSKHSAAEKVQANKVEIEQSNNVESIVKNNTNKTVDGIATDTKILTEQAQSKNNQIEKYGNFAETVEDSVSKNVNSNNIENAKVKDSSNFKHESFGTSDILLKQAKVSQEQLESPITSEKTSVLATESSSQKDLAMPSHITEKLMAEISEQNTKAPINERSTLDIKDGKKNIESIRMSAESYAKQSFEQKVVVENITDDNVTKSIATANVVAGQNHVKEIIGKSEVKVDSLAVKGEDVNVSAQNGERGQQSFEQEQSNKQFTDKAFVAKAEIEKADVLTNVNNDNGKTRDISNILGQSTITNSVQESATVTQAITDKMTLENTTGVQNKPTVNVNSETIAIHKKDFSEKIKEKVMVMVNQKIRQVEIRLDPPELGSMQIRLNLQNEQAAVNFIVQNQQAKEAVDENMTKLKEMLSDSGVDVGDANVEQQSQNETADDSRRNEFNGQQENHEQVDDNLVKNGAQLYKASSTGVDYFV